MREAWNSSSRESRLDLGVKLRCMKIMYAVPTVTYLHDDEKSIECIRLDRLLTTVQQRMKDWELVGKCSNSKLGHLLATCPFLHSVQWQRSK